ncbi:MAG: DUF4339 domain-containing protein, partial [Planctomycetaceae bacterium]|nr:DUF4339 domain-containing protein [Planctomycetaceae bacterium]
MHTEIWYYERDGQQIGPFRLADLQHLAGTGLIQPETMLVRYRVVTTPGTGVIRPRMPTDSGERLTCWISVTAGLLPSCRRLKAP